MLRINHFFLLLLNAMFIYLQNKIKKKNEQKIECNKKQIFFLVALSLLEILNYKQSLYHAMLKAS